MFTRHNISLLAAFALVGVVSLRTPARGQGPSPIPTSARGGLIAITPQHQFEVFFYRSGVRVFPESKAGLPVDVSHATATATFYHPNSPAPWFVRPLRRSTDQPGSLELAIGLTDAPASDAKVTLEIAGLPGAETKASFTLPLAFATSAAPAPASPPAYTNWSVDVGQAGYPYGGNAVFAPESNLAPFTPPAYRHGGEGHVGPGHPDWSTGRDLPLAKPWMRPEG